MRTGYSKSEKMDPWVSKSEGKGTKSEPRDTKSEPKGNQKWFQIQVFYVKRPKKGTAKDPSVH